MHSHQNNPIPSDCGPHPKVPRSRWFQRVLTPKLNAHRSQKETKAKSQPIQRCRTNNLNKNCDGRNGTHANPSFSKCLQYRGKKKCTSCDNEKFVKWHVSTCTPKSFLTSRILSVDIPYNIISLYLFFHKIVRTICIFSIFQKNNYLKGSNVQPKYQEWRNEQIFVYSNFLCTICIVICICFRFCSGASRIWLVTLLSMFVLKGYIIKTILILRRVNTPWDF